MKVRTKSGRIVDKIVYVSKDDYEAMKAGTKDAKDVRSSIRDIGTFHDSTEDLRLSRVLLASAHFLMLRETLN